MLRILKFYYLHNYYPVYGILEFHQCRLQKLTSDMGAECIMLSYNLEVGWLGYCSGHCTCCTKAMSRPMGAGQPSIDGEERPAIHGVQHVTVGHSPAFPPTPFFLHDPILCLAFWAPSHRVGGHNQTKTLMTTNVKGSIEEEPFNAMAQSLGAAI